MVDAYPVDLGGIVPYSQCRLNHVRHFGFVFVNATGFVYCSVVCSRCCVLLFYPAHAVRFIDVRGSYVPHCKGYFRRQVFLWCATFSVFTPSRPNMAFERDAPKARAPQFYVMRFFWFMLYRSNHKEEDRYEYDSGVQGVRSKGKRD